MQQKYYQETALRNRINVFIVGTVPYADEHSLDLGARFFLFLFFIFLFYFFFIFFFSKKCAHVGAAAFRSSAVAMDKY